MVPEVQVPPETVLLKVSVFGIHTNDAPEIEEGAVTTVTVVVA